ncbi:MAG: T9SS type A sorting domain-containing protein [Saprospiraceae bacterium]
MAKIITLLFISLLYFTGNGQRTLYQYSFEAKEKYVRTDTAFQIFKTDIEVPQEGHVIARIEGNCLASNADKITIAVSNSNDWQSNYGNYGVLSYDSIHTTHFFMHTMVYEVEPGNHSFYALMHNWVSRKGSGIASIKGKMILEYIPKESGEDIVIDHQVTLTPAHLNQNEKVLDSIEFDLEQITPMILSANFSIYSLKDQSLEISLQYSDISGANKKTIPFHFVDDDKLPCYSLSDIALFPKGKNLVYLVGKRIVLDSSYAENGLYMTFFASPLEENGKPFPFINEPITSSFSSTGSKVSLVDLEWEIPSKGQLYILSSGYCEGEIGDKLDLLLEVNGQTVQDTAVISTYVTNQEDKQMTFTLHQVIDIDQKQDLDIQMFGIFNDPLNASFSKQMVGDIKGYFIAEPILSSAFNEDFYSIQWSVLPNPTSGQLILQKKQPSNIPSKIDIYNQSGILLFSINEDTASLTNLDLSAFPSNEYLIVIQSGKNQEIHKIISIR